MLSCIYHPVKGMHVVTDDEKGAFLASGFWFDSPKKAAEFSDKPVVEVNIEPKPVRKNRFKKENEDAK